MAISLAFLLLPLIIYELNSSGLITAQTVYFQNYYNVLQHKTILMPDIEKMLKNKEEFYDENSKLVPMYIYTYGLKCDQIKYQVTLNTLNTK